MAEAQTTKILSDSTRSMIAFVTDVTAPWPHGKKKRERMI